MLFNSAATLIYIHTFSPNWINELRGNGTRFADNALSDAGNTVDYGVPYDNVQNYPFALQYGVASSTTTPANFAENTYEVRDMLNYVFGSHTFRAGVELRFEQDNDNLYGYERPTFAFNGLWAFSNDASVFEQQYANTTTGGPANTQRYLRSQNYAAFLQHDWKVSPNFTFNAGLRWEEFTPIDNKGFAMNYPLLGPTGSELSGMRLIPRNHLWNFQHNNWGPKIGFAYTPAFLNGKVVRCAQATRWHTTISTSRSSTMRWRMGLGSRTSTFVAAVQAIQPASSTGAEAARRRRASRSTRRSPPA